ncbi:MAG TPA: hypothetical protein VF175_01870 [Lacipirellula sp.]
MILFKPAEDSFKNSARPRQVMLQRSFQLPNAAAIFKRFVPEVALPLFDDIALLLAVGQPILRRLDSRPLLAARRPLVGDGHHKTAFQIHFCLVESVLGFADLASPVRGPIVFEPLLGAMELSIERIQSGVHALLEAGQRRLERFNRRR